MVEILREDFINHLPCYGCEVCGWATTRHPEWFTKIEREAKKDIAIEDDDWKLQEQTREFILSIENLAFSMPAPNPYTPQFVQLCQTARIVLRRPVKYFKEDMNGN